MTLEVQPAIKVHQCLFGYEDGHRLLASSLRLPNDATSLLHLLSDLAPGVPMTDAEGYWTGVPLPSAKFYALMRTWPAPEMPRPGCVWTHALLIGLSDIGRLVDLGALTNLAARPVLAERFDAYSHALPANTASQQTSGGENCRTFDATDALRVIRAIYEERPKGSLVAPLRALDGVIFAAWSQQWPRLRRSFSFRTAASALEVSMPGLRFDLLVICDSERDAAQSAAVSEPHPEAWAAAAVEDLRSVQPSEFRRFLWRYGPDIRRGREYFRFLADLYVSTRAAPSVANGQLVDILSRVSRVLPARDDGRLLKEDLVSCGRSRYSLLPPGDTLDTLEFFVRHPEAEALPPPPAEAFEAVRNLWATRSDEVLALAEVAAESQSELGEMLLERFAGLADPATFLASTADRPNLRHRLVTSNPSLLDSDDLPRVRQPELSRLLDLVPDDESVARRVISRLLVLDDRQVANDMLVRFPDMTMHLLAEGVGASVSRTWLWAVAGRTGDLLRSGLVEKARSTSVLAAFAAMLGYDRPEVLQVGPLPWAAALSRARDDVQGYRRQVFLAFLLAIAITKPVLGCEPLFERAFEPVHADLLQSSLPSEASARLTRYLPDLHWWQQWDTCLRLRVAVVDAYVEGELNPQSFRRLTSDGDLFERLVDLAERTQRGRRFIQRLAV